MHHIASRSLPWKICELRASCISPTSPKKRGQSEIFLCKSWVEPAFQLVKYATWEGAPFPFPLKNFQDFKMGGGPVSFASGQLRVVFHISCFWIVSISEEGGWWCHRFYSSAFTHDRTVHYSIAFQCVALCQNSLHCVKMQCTACIKYSV